MTAPEAGVRLARLRRSVEVVRERWPEVPEVALLMEGDIPALAAPGGGVDLAIRDLPLGTANGSPAPGGLRLSAMSGVHLAALEGLPEGYDDRALALRTDAIRLVHLLGARTLLVVGRCAPLRGSIPNGGLVLVTDHLNLTGTNPLVGPNEESIGPRFPDMTEAYDPGLREVARDAAAALGIPLSEAVYAGVAGPQGPTAAEPERYASLGADVLGPGLVASTIVARHAGMRVLALAVPTGRWEDVLQATTGAPRAAAPSQDPHRAAPAFDLIEHILRTLPHPT